MAFSRSASNEAGDDQRRDDAKNAAVARLQQVEATGIPCASLRDLIGSEDIPLAYLVQEQIVSARVTDNNGRVERKIGLTSPAVQAQLKVDQPDFGTLLHDMLVTQAEPVANDRLLQPRIEAEIAFALGADIDDLALPRDHRRFDPIRSSGVRDRRQPHRRVGHRLPTPSPTTLPAGFSYSAMPRYLCPTSTLSRSRSQ